MKHTLLLAASLMTAATTLPSIASADDHTTIGWFLGVNKGASEATLFHGSDNAEILNIDLTCDATTGLVTVFIPETDATVSVGDAGTVKISVGEASGEFTGIALPGETENAPAFKAEGSIDQPVFSALKGAGLVDIAVNDYSTRIFLASIENQGDVFRDICSS